MEICVAEVGATPDSDELYRLTYDGSVGDEPGFVAMGGQAEAIVALLRDRHQSDMSLDAALHLAMDALGTVGGEGGKKRQLTPDQLEVAVLDRRRSGRTFRRITGAMLTNLLQPNSDGTAGPASTGTTEAPDSGTDAADLPASGDAAPAPEAETSAETSTQDDSGTGGGKSNGGRANGPKRGDKKDS